MELFSENVFKSAELHLEILRESVDPQLDSVELQIESAELLSEYFESSTKNIKFN
jgi:hypothetical protein